MLSRLAVLSVSGLALALWTGDAWAGSKISASTGEVAQIKGSFETTDPNRNSPSSNRDPWLVQVFSVGNECVRIAVTSQSTGADLEATLVSPSGQIWQDDDSNGSLRPLIRAQTDIRGWFPLVISQFNGGNVFPADFTLTYQRGGNASCNPPTLSRIPALVPGK